MAFRTWAKLLGATVGLSALAGASQLGLAYGLGVVQLSSVAGGTTRDQWSAQLAWVAWFAMVAAVIGVLVGSSAYAVTRDGVGARIALASAAGLGATIVVPLTMQPARTAQIAGVHPVFVIGLSAGLGAGGGIVAAYAALSSIVARWSLLSIGAAVWLVTIASVTPSDPRPAVRLGVFDASYLNPAASRLTALFTLPILALAGGALLGWAARRRELATLTIALAGLPGPALVTVAYLIAGPSDGRYQVIPYWASMTAVGAGVLGSVLAAVLRRGGAIAGEPAERLEIVAGMNSPLY